jgi:exopolyphosphatase/guanosine-5'-triphosphate,3'-diphosphate pyrophosphatase
MGLRDTILGQGGNDRQAVIDIGSNTVRLVIYGGPSRAPVVLLNEKVSARLGKGVAENGRLSPKAAAAALAALRRYAALTRVMGFATVQTVATAAVRDASNGADFLAEVAKLGLKPRLLSGEEEALTSALGVIGAFPQGRGVVADLGGGSLELVHIAAGVSEHGSSLPLGSLRLPALRAAGATKFRRRTERMFAATGVACQPGEALYLVGGSFRALARYHLHASGVPLDDPHGLEISATDLLAECRRLQRAKVLAEVPGLSPSRLASLPDTAALLAALIQALGPARVVFSGWGLREGLVFARLTPAQRQVDPLAAGVRTFAEPLGASPAIAAMVAGWTAEVAGSTDKEGEDLRLAATMLALALQQVEPNLRGVTALDWALHKRWIGAGGACRAMIATCLLANANRTLPPEVIGLAPPERLAEAITWGLAIRLCRRLTGLAPQMFSASALRRDDRELQLTLDPRARDLASEAVEKDFRLLAQHLGLTAVIRAA